MSKPRVLIADDHALVAEGLSSLLAEKYQIVGISPNGRRLLVDAAELKPDVIVLDIGMPELNGIEAAVQLGKTLPTAKLVFVTQRVDVQYLRAAFRAGGAAYVAKQSATQELLIAMERALAGEVYVTPLLKDALPNISLEALRQTTDVFARELTPRQREVLQLVAEGKTIKEISAALKISPKTVEFHKNALMNEIGLRTTADLTRYAISRGVISG
ncbi:MAG TPA: response regulator transcription factor [Acidobacteriaceae bacterium]